MGIKKQPGGLEDLTMGMGTETQLRKGVPTTITQINGGQLPFTNTVSVSDKLTQLDGVDIGLRTGLDSHTNNKNNPHELNAGSVNAFDKTDDYITVSGGASDVGRPVVLGVDGKLDPSLGDGADGAKGDAATCDGGVATSLAYGEDPVVTNVGTLHAAIFNFAIPVGMTGAEGEQGLPGMGIYPQGEATVAEINAFTSDPGAGALWVMLDAGTVTYGSKDVVVDVDDWLGWGEEGYFVNLGPIEGPAGADGEDGAVWYTGNSNPLDADGKDNDMYLNNLTSDYFKKVAGTWGTALGNLQGIPGPTVVSADVGNTVSLGTDSYLFVAMPTAGQVGAEPANTNIQAHIANVTTNPHAVTKAQVGLGSADDTSDANKPISDATQTALDLKADDTDLDLKISATGDTMTGQLKGIPAIAPDDMVTKGFMELFLAMAINDYRYATSPNISPRLVENGEFLTEYRFDINNWVENVIYYVKCIYPIFIEYVEILDTYDDPTGGYFNVAIDWQQSIEPLLEFELLFSANLDMPVESLPTFAKVQIVNPGTVLASYVSNSFEDNTQAQLGFSDIQSYANPDFEANMEYYNGFSDIIVFNNDDFELYYESGNGFSDGHTQSNTDFQTNEAYNNGFTY